MRRCHADDKNGSWFEGSAFSMEVFLQQLINGLTLGSIYGLIAIGYTMVFGIIGMVNFAHGDIFMLSAFIALIFFMLITAVVGTGAATKLQVQHMVKTLLSLAGDPQEDAADALAVALCHAHTQKSLINAADSAGKFRRGRIR